MSTRICTVLAFGWLVGGCEQAPESLVAKRSAGLPQPTQRVFLQQLSDDGVTIKWRGTADYLHYGIARDDLSGGVIHATETEGQHKQVQLVDLQPDTRYFYSIAGADKDSTAASFRTAPPIGQLPSSGRSRFWIIGDSGTANRVAKAVRDGFVLFNKEQSVDGLLMLGDNAYQSGSDAQYQRAVFGIYAEILASTPVWPTIGNHDMGVARGKVGEHVYELGGLSASADPNSWIGKAGDTPQPAPYFNIFTLPEEGELGGVASGTEQYYSFNYGNIHVVSLDSQLATRDEKALSKMTNWLKDDLTYDRSAWTVVIFHHSPYSKGQHDSDHVYTVLDSPAPIMREHFTPIFESHDVDIVFSGHSHSYERSFNISGHQGLSNTFDAKTHAELNAAGKPVTGAKDQVFHQTRSGAGTGKVVYTVAGSSGEASRGPLNHPAHFAAYAGPGSVVLDITRTQLQVRLIDVKGQVKDEFILDRYRPVNR
jgi:hypothetical protein